MHNTLQSSHSNLLSLPTASKLILYADSGHSSLGEILHPNKHVNVQTNEFFTSNIYFNCYQFRNRQVAVFVTA